MRRATFPGPVPPVTGIETAKRVAHNILETTSRGHMFKCAIATLLVGVTTPAIAQVPERFENLQFFPKTIARDSLLTVMRGFSFALGVRCVHCHVGEDSPTLAGVDFKSDDRPAKRTARAMLQMVADINSKVAAAVSNGAPLTVQCATCHRGIPRPVALEDSIYKVVQSRGGAAALVEYDSLRARYHGRSAFDFGSGALIRVSERLLADKRHEDALPLLRRNAELFPRGWNTYWELGRHLEALQRPAEAIVAYRAVLERLPNHPGAVARLRALGGRALRGADFRGARTSKRRGLPRGADFHGPRTSKGRGLPGAADFQGPRTSKGRGLPNGAGFQGALPP